MPSSDSGMLTRTRTASKGAIQNIYKRKHGNEDKHIQIYDSLTSQDFGDMIKEFGAENVMDYIQTMEGRRLRGRK